MTNLSEATTASECLSGKGWQWRRDLHLVLAATLIALGVWALWTASGDGEITVQPGSGVARVGAGSVGLTTAVVSLAGVLLLRLMMARLTNGLRWWTIIAAMVLLISTLGPLAATNLSDGLVLLSLHTTVGAIVVFGLRGTHGASCGTRTRPVGDTATRTT